MKHKNSLAFRLTVMVLVLLLMTIGAMTLLTKFQMDAHFSQYLYNSSHMMGQGRGMRGMHGMMHGPAETVYLSSVHNSLFWLGLGMALLSALICFLMVRETLRPLKDLTQAARAIKRGRYDQHVPVHFDDEVGLLTETFNEMASTLDEAEKGRRQLFANMAHELRTPLAIISSNLEGMIDDVLSFDKKRLLSMEDEALRMGRLIQNLRDLSLAEVGQLELHKEKGNLAVLLKKAVAMMAPLFEEKKLSVTLSLEESLPDLLFDRDRMNQVIYNLLNNAVRYVPQGRSLTISAATEMEGKTAYLLTEIRDTGDGVPPDRLSHLFQYFYRGETSRNRQSGGSGI
uniref:HAMP domain-containing protein n=1 Tax=uncultured Acidaminococcus sp. TaxID=352152 RepID=UPI0025DE170C